MPDSVPDGTVSIPAGTGPDLAIFIPWKSLSILPIARFRSGSSTGSTGSTGTMKWVAAAPEVEPAWHLQLHHTTWARGHTQPRGTRFTTYHPPWHPGVAQTPPTPLRAIPPGALPCEGPPSPSLTAQPSQTLARAVAPRAGGHCPCMTPGSLLTTWPSVLPSAEPVFGQELAASTNWAFPAVGQCWQ